VKDRYPDDVHPLEREKRTKQFAPKKKQQESAVADTSGEDALVIGVGQGVCIVRTASGDRVCRTKKGVVVGDRVNVDAHRVLATYPRSTVLVRPDPRNARNERALAANVDIVVIVASVHSPPLRTGLIDRYLIAAQNGAMQPVIVVNKIDLLQDESELNELKAYDGIGVALVLCSTKDGRGMEELRAVLAGKTCVFSGHSGVGKSSLANALLPGLDLRIGAVEYKGQHTTTMSSLHEMPGGTRVIDTPGIREFGLTGVTQRELRHFFPEFEEYARQCNFNDCTHTHEPVCAVREANLPRYPTYVRIYESLGDQP
jgi:ribosome biogenesis GTPase / thiamine phosphate phosphatase